MGRTLQFHNFSWKGDPRWAGASRFTLYGPAVVCVILFLSIAEIAFGSVWLVQLNSNMSVYVVSNDQARQTDRLLMCLGSPKIIQTLLIPGCSFFNAIPSLHLHYLLRSNPPKLAICFSSIFAVVYLVSSLLILASCTSASPLSLRKTECPVGTPGLEAPGVSRGIWAALGVAGLLSTLCYGIHGSMAYYVKRVLDQRKRDGVVPAEDPEEIEARNAKARELWIKMTNHDIL